jgi:fucose permease
MLVGMAGAAACYLIAGISLNPVVILSACAISGICVSMLWPGTLIFAEERFSNLGVASYALLAAGGDLGASVAPQLVGVISDYATTLEVVERIADRFGITIEQVGMRAGMLSAAAFPIVGVIVLTVMRNKRKVKGV